MLPLVVTFPLLPLILGNFMDFLYPIPYTDLSLFFMIMELSILSDCFFIISYSNFDNLSNYFCFFYARFIRLSYSTDLCCESIFYWYYLYLLMLFLELCSISLIFFRLSCLFFIYDYLYFDEIYSFFMCYFLTIS